MLRDGLSARVTTAWPHLDEVPGSSGTGSSLKWAQVCATGKGHHPRGGREDLEVNYHHGSRGTSQRWRDATTPCGEESRESRGGSWGLTWPDKDPPEGRPLPRRAPGWARSLTAAFPSWLPIRGKGGPNRPHTSQARERLTETFIPSQREGDRAGRGRPCRCTEPVLERSPAPDGLTKFTLLASLRTHLNKEKISPKPRFCSQPRGREMQDEPRHSTVLSSCFLTGPAEPCASPLTVDANLPGPR